MATGTMLFFKAEAGRGYVRDDADGAEYFVHASHCPAGTTLQNGDRISFEVRADPRSGRLQAVNVSLL